MTADTYLNASTEITDSAVTPGTYSAHRDSNDIAGQERWDAWFNRTLNCTRELYWDDVTSLGLKYDLINRSGLRGVGIWNLNYGGGAPELWSALLSHFAGCQAVAGTASPRSPAPAGTMVTVTASASGCGNPSPRYGFWLQPPGATTWQLLQQYSTNPNFVWNTAGKPPGSYRFSIWALDAASGGTAGNSLGRWDAYAMLSITLTSTPCGCPNPRYQFELLNPGSQTWRIVQAYSSNAIFNWSTTGTTVGAYRFSIWARDASSQGLASSSLGSWDVFITPQYTLAKPCSGLAVTTMPNAAAPTGTNVAVTGTAFGCPNPRYQFELLTSGSQTWQIVQTYSSNATFNWNTTGYPPGAYQLSVWAKDANSPGLVGNSLGSWDVYVMAVYALTTPCTAVTAAFTPSSSAKSGTTVSISVSASGCNNPQFEFWILYPGSQTWQLARGYGAVTTFSWSTAGKPVGTYRFSVWARDAGSPGTLGNVNGTWDAYSGPYFTLT